MSTDRTTDGPDRLGPYRLEGLLGRGGMGEVHRAFDTRRGRLVALKVLPPELAHDESFRIRLRRESDNAARLQDPHVIPIHDFGEIDGRLFIDMRLVDGVGLDRVIAAGPMDPRRAVALITQVAEALTDAHAHGVLHRDVKPSNILVTRSDFVYLVDFGIARALVDDVTALTRSGATIGTLAYMAPERFDGGTPDARSDIYSLACTLAECLIGRAPFDATSLPSLMKAHLTSDPPRPSRTRPDVPPAFDDVIARGMAKDPAARYPTARDLAAAAQYALAQWGPLSAAAPAPTPPTAIASVPGTAIAPVPARGRARVPALVAGAALLAVAAGGSGFALGRTSAPATVQAAPSTGAPTAQSASPPPPLSPSPRPAPTTASVPSSNPGPIAMRSERAPGYVYTVESNYPVLLIYTDSKGDRITATSVPAPWRLDVDTSAWGADATPALSAGSSSTKGDTTVTCTITDDQGKVVATQTRESAHATVSCAVFF